MRHSFPIAFATALIATSSVAQSGPPAQQSSEELVCELSGDCGELPAEATRDKPESRGFSIANPHPAASPSSSPRQRQSLVRTPGRSAAVQPASQSATRQAITSGRADLMISFVSGSATLTGQAKANAQQFIAALASPRLSNMRFTIEGHTDAVGNRAYNLDLSQRRAQAVVDYLDANGVDRSRFEVRGYGFDRPIDPQNPRSAVNRRVEVVKVD